MTTERQKRAVEFCESMGCDEFLGDIEDFREVSKYLSENLDHAKVVRDELEGLHPYDLC